MKVKVMSITLAELKKALSDYADKRGVGQPEVVHIESYDKVRLELEMRREGNVTCFGPFSHTVRED